MLTNDYEPRVIVRSCIEVMLSYFRKNHLVSFGFIAAPDLEKDIKGKNLKWVNGSRRFSFYQKVMINLFGPQTFLQAADTTNTLYLMINMEQLRSGTITIKDIEEKLNQIYEGEFIIDNQ